MKAFWNGLARVLVKAALWSATHPSVVIDVVQAVATKSADPLTRIPGDLSK